MSGKLDIQDKPSPPPRNRISRPHDLRAVKSRQALRQALLSLIEKQTLEQITIKEITREAGVSYPVFFRQFASKDELLADLATNEVRSLLEKSYPAFTSDAAAGGLSELCHYVAEHRVLWTALLTTGAASAMRAEFARISSEFAVHRPRANPWLPVELASAFVSSGMFEILAWWLNQPEDYPIANVITLLDALIVRSVSNPQNIQLI